MRRREFSLEKKTTPARGGEEAEVVAYQPRGVGLIHLGISRVMLTIHM